MKKHVTPPIQSKSTRRHDGMTARNKILEAAGKVFATRGFEEATSKEIAEYANTNAAAINYYFGGKEQLYGEVLHVAHNQIMDKEQLEDIISADMQPEEKLRAVLQYFLQVANNTAKYWGVGVLLRTIISPSPAAVEIMPTVIMSKANIVSTLVQEITGFPADSPQLQRAVVLVVFPLLMHMLIPNALKENMPLLASFNAENTLEDIYAYTLNGLRALCNNDDAG